MAKVSFLDPIRSVVPAAARERAYVVVTMIVGVLASWSLLDASLVQPVLQLVLSTLTLGFAVLYATSAWRTALYGVLLAVQALAMALHFLNDQQWTAILALAATLLGTATAAAKTPTPIMDGQGDQTGFSETLPRAA
jgi:uncharacterized membrane protein